MAETEQEISKEEDIQENALIIWEAPDLFEHTRGWKYFSGLTIFFIILIAYFAYTKDWFAVVILVLLPILIVTYQIIRKPNVKTYTITELGVYENDLFYPYEEIYSFWLNINDFSNTLNIIFTKKYLPQLTVQLREIDPIKIREILTKYIPEETSKKESIIDKLARLLKI